MILIEEVVYKYLESELTQVSGRIYPQVALQGTDYPCVVYNRVSGSDNYSHDGRSCLATPRIGFRVLSKCYKEAKDVMKKLRALMDDFPGIRWSDTDIQAAYNGSELDSYDDESEVRVIISDCRIFYKDPGVDS